MNDQRYEYCWGFNNRYNCKVLLSKKLKENKEEIKSISPNTNKYESEYEVDKNEQPWWYLLGSTLNNDDSYWDSFPSWPHFGAVEGTPSLFDKININSDKGPDHTTNSINLSDIFMGNIDLSKVFPELIEENQKLTYKAPVFTLEKWQGSVYAKDNTKNLDTNYYMQHAAVTYNNNKREIYNKTDDDNKKHGIFAAYAGGDGAGFKNDGSYSNYIQRIGIAKTYDPNQFSNDPNRGQAVINCNNDKNIMWNWNFDNIDSFLNFFYKIIFNFSYATTGTDAVDVGISDTIWSSTHFINEPDQNPYQLTGSQNSIQYDYYFPKDPKDPDPFYNYKSGAIHSMFFDFDFLSQLGSNTDRDRVIALSQHIFNAHLFVLNHHNIFWVSTKKKKILKPAVGGMMYEDWPSGKYEYTMYSFMSAVRSAAWGQNIQIHARPGEAWAKDEKDSFMGVQNLAQILVNPLSQFLLICQRNSYFQSFSPWCVNKNKGVHCCTKGGENLFINPFQKYIIGKPNDPICKFFVVNDGEKDQPTNTDMSGHIFMTRDFKYCTVYYHIVDVDTYANSHANNSLEYRSHQDFSGGITINSEKYGTHCMIIWKNGLQRYSVPENITNSLLNDDDGNKDNSVYWLSYSFPLESTDKKTIYWPSKKDPTGNIIDRYSNKFSYEFINAELGTEFIHGKGDDKFYRVVGASDFIKNAKTFFKHFTNQDGSSTSTEKSWNDIVSEYLTKSKIRTPTNLFGNSENPHTWQFDELERFLDVDSGNQKVFNKLTEDSAKELKRQQTATAGITDTDLDYMDLLNKVPN